MTRRVLVILLAACVLGCSKSSGSAGGAKPSRAFIVKTTQVASRDLSYEVEAIGSIEAYQTVTVPARVEGAIEKVEFEEGDQVSQKKVLAVIDGERYRLREASAEAAARQATAQVARAKAAIDEAQSALARRKGLREKDPGYVTDEEMAAQTAAVAKAQADVEQARASEEASKAMLALEKKNLADSNVIPPLDGTIEMKMVAVGQYVKVGDKLAMIIDTQHLRLRFRVGEDESVRLQLGQQIAFRVKSGADHDYLAKLFHVNTSADPTTRMVECLADIEDKDANLKPGFFATVRIEVAKSQGAVVIPDISITPTEGGYVAYVVEEGKAHARTLVLGLHTRDGWVEILSGLIAGETIVTTGAQTLQDGVAVQVVQDAASTNNTNPADPSK